MNEIECPYCEYSYDLCHDDGAFYDQSDPTEEECPKCEKKYLVYSNVSWNFSAEKAECLNTGVHVWVKVYPEHMFKDHPQLISRERCSECGDERNIATLS